MFAAMNGAWLVNSAMVIVAAAAFAGTGRSDMTIEEAHRTLGPLLGPASATIFAVALLCSGLSSSTVGTMAGQMILEGFLKVRFSIFLRRLLTLLPALMVIGMGLDPLRILVLSQVALSFTLPFALVPLLILCGRRNVMGEFTNGRVTSVSWLADGDDHSCPQCGALGLTLPRDTHRPKCFRILVDHERPEQTSRLQFPTWL